jgi:hypothetical protein
LEYIGPPSGGPFKRHVEEGIQGIDWGEPAEAELQ